MRTTTIRVAAVAVLAAMQLWSCGDDGGPGFGNQPPTVWLSSAPPEGSVSRYTVHLYWGGWDPDGEVAFYEYVITDNETGVFDPADTVSTPGDYKWQRVNVNDSTFTFSADLIPDSTVVNFGGSHQPEEFRRSHTFFIRSVDREGMRSVKPVYRSFTARTLSPTVFVDIPIASGLNAAEVPPITTFHWTARDYVGSLVEVTEPDSVRHILVPTSRFNLDWNATLAYIRNNPAAPEWSQWTYYGLPGDSGKFWTSPPLDFGRYYFAVQAKDEAGAVSPVFDLDHNLRRVSVGPRTTGPILRVLNQFIGVVQTAVADTPPVILDLPAGVPLVFEFWGDAESYGGIVSGYRYGWDILDLNDSEQWEIDYTPFVGERAKSPSRSFFFGSHSIFIEVIDNSGFKSRVEVRVNIVPFSMERDLLLVDDWLEGNSCFSQNNGTVPCDAEQDAFWTYVLNSAKGFNPNTDVFELGTGGRQALPIQVLAKYKNLIWLALGNDSGRGGSYLDVLITFIDPDGPPASGKTSPNLVALYMAAGGHVLLAGNQIMTLAINHAVFPGVAVLYPIIFRYELDGDQDGSYGGDNVVGEHGVGEDSFAYDECCLNVLDLSYHQNPNQMRRVGFANQRCGVNLIRDRNRARDGLRTALPRDVTTGGGFPQLDLRPEVSDSLKFLSINGMIVDMYNPIYFSNLTPCGSPNGGVAEINPPRSCLQPIYGNGCTNTSSLLYNTTVAFWTTQRADRVADVAGAVAARSAVWGFSPVFFNPDQVKTAMQIILHDEWRLPRN